MNKDQLNKMNASQKQNLIQKFNFKRYSKVRVNVLINFLIAVIFIYNIEILNFKPNNFTFWISIILVFGYFMLSFPYQIFCYYTKLPTKHYKISLNTTYLFVDNIKLVITILNLIWFGWQLSFLNINSLIVNTIIVLLFSAYNLYLNKWIDQVLIQNKDKYYNPIKTVYLSLKKQERNF